MCMADLWYQEATTRLMTLPTSSSTGVLMVIPIHSCSITLWLTVSRRLWLMSLPASSSTIYIDIEIVHLWEVKPSTGILARPPPSYISASRSERALIRRNTPAAIHRFARGSLDITRQTTWCAEVGPGSNTPYGRDRPSPK